MRPVIFDLDDTLIESFPTYVELHRQVARELGMRVPSRADLVHYADSWEATLRDLWPDLDLAAFVARYNELADTHAYPSIPGAIEVLSVLRQRGCSLWIVTKRNKRRLRQRMADALLPFEWFSGVFPREEQPAAKPDPRCFEPVWERLGCVDDRAVFVGDREEDHLAASRAGIQFVGVRTGPEATFGCFDGLRPCDVLDSIADFITWLDRSTSPPARPSVSREHGAE